MAKHTQVEKEKKQCHNPRWCYRKISVVYRGDSIVKIYFYVTNTLCNTVGRIGWVNRKWIALILRWSWLWFWKSHKLIKKHRQMEKTRNNRLPREVNVMCYCFNWSLNSIVRVVSNKLKNYVKIILTNFDLIFWGFGAFESEFVVCFKWRCKQRS